MCHHSMARSAHQAMNQPDRNSPPLSSGFARSPGLVEEIKKRLPMSYKQTLLLLWPQPIAPPSWIKKGRSESVCSIMISDLGRCQAGSMRSGHRQLTQRGHLINTQPPTCPDRVPRPHPNTPKTAQLPPRTVSGDSSPIIKPHAERFR